MDKVIVYNNPISAWLWESGSMTFFYALCAAFILTAWVADTFGHKAAKKFFVVFLGIAFYIIFLM